MSPISPIAVDNWINPRWNAVYANFVVIDAVRMKRLHSENLDAFADDAVRIASGNAFSERKLSYLIETILFGGLASVRMPNTGLARVGGEWMR